MHEAHDYGVNLDTNPGQLLASRRTVLWSRKSNIGPRAALRWAPEARHGNTGSSMEPLPLICSGSLSIPHDRRLQQAYYFANGSESEDETSD